jgi:hypothetical protein
MFVWPLQRSPSASGYVFMVIRTRWALIIALILFASAQTQAQRRDNAKSRDKAQSRAEAQNLSVWQREPFSLFGIQVSAGLASPSFADGIFEEVAAEYYLGPRTSATVRVTNLSHDATQGADDPLRSYTGSTFLHSIDVSAGARFSIPAPIPLHADAGIGLSRITEVRVDLQDTSRTYAAPTSPWPFLTIGVGSQIPLTSSVYLAIEIFEMVYLNGPAVDADVPRTLRSTFEKYSIGIELFL